MRFSTPNVRFFTPMEVHQPIAQVFLFKGEPEDVAAHKLIRICLNTSCIRVPKRSFLAPVVFELYRVAGKCDRSPRSTLLRWVDFKACFDEMRRHHLTITCNGCKKPSQKLDFCSESQKELLKDRRQLSECSVYLQPHQQLTFSRRKKRRHVLLCVSDGSEALGIFQLGTLWSR